MTDAERKQRERDRMRDQGKVRLEVWGDPSIREALKKSADRLNREAERAKKKAEKEKR